MALRLAGAACRASRPPRGARAYAAAAAVPPPPPPPQPPAGGPSPPPSGMSFEQLRASVRASDFEGYLCSSLLPSPARPSGLAVRALNAELAAARDAARGNAATARLRLAFWRDVVDRAFTGRASQHPLAAPLTAAVAAHGHTRRWFDRLIDARDGDLDAPPPASLDALDDYGEATAASILYLALEAVGVRSAAADEAASHVGRALSACTLLRALPVHARLGVRYIPDDVMAKVN
jgi:NADH dehydrogenase [ubiquinone] 1 alpha subcomplex assembly factor 6